jgi:hypothetical protein
MARPRGDLFDAVLRVLERVRCATWPAVHAELLRNGLVVSGQVVRRVVDNLARRGYLVRAGVQREPGVYRPLRVFAVPGPEAAAVVPLAQVMGQWGAPAGQS